MGVTPLQLAVMAARLGNNGRAVLPRLVREAPGVTDPPHAAAHDAGIEADHLARVRDGMFGVCNEPGGTAMRAGNMNLRAPSRNRRDRADARRRTAGWHAGADRRQNRHRASARARRPIAARHYSTIEWRYRDNALFCCFGPWHEPRYACAVVVEHGGAAPASPARSRARSCAQRLLRDPSRRPPARLAQLEAAWRGRA